VFLLRQITLRDEVWSLIISLSETRASSQDDGQPLLPGKYQWRPQMVLQGFIFNKEKLQSEVTLFSGIVEAALKEYTYNTMVSV
jgi:hypothetical protein